MCLSVPASMVTRDVRGGGADAVDPCPGCPQERAAGPPRRASGRLGAGPVRQRARDRGHARDGSCHQPGGVVATGDLRRHRLRHPRGTHAKPGGRGGRRRGSFPLARHAAGHGRPGRPRGGCRRPPAAAGRLGERRQPAGAEARHGGAPGPSAAQLRGPGAGAGLLLARRRGGRTRRGGAARGRPMAARTAPCGCRRRRGGSARDARRRPRRGPAGSHPDAAPGGGPPHCARHAGPGCAGAGSPRHPRPEVRHRRGTLGPPPVHADRGSPRRAPPPARRGRPRLPWRGTPGGGPEGRAHPRLRRRSHPRASGRGHRLPPAGALRRTPGRGLLTR